MRVKSLIGIVIVLYTMGIFQAFAAPGPLDVVRNGTDRVFQTIKSYASDTKTRRQELRRISGEYFDFEEMAKRSLGQYWNSQSPQKRQEFTTIFSQFLFNEYVKKIEDVTMAQMKFSGQEVKGDYAMVSSTMMEKQGEETPIDYRLHLKDGNWLVYDISVGGVSLVNNYRSQFGSILSRSSFDSLLSQLKERNGQQS